MVPVISAAPYATISRKPFAIGSPFSEGKRQPAAPRQETPVICKGIFSSLLVMEQRIQECRGVFGPAAFFSHMHTGVNVNAGSTHQMLIFYRRTPVSQHAAFEEAIGLLDRDSMLDRDSKELQMTLIWRDTSEQRIRKVVRELGHDSFNVYTVGDPPPASFREHTHTRQELMDTVASPFLNARPAGKAVQVACYRLRASYEVTREFKDDGKTIRQEDAHNAVFYEPFKGDDNFFYLLQNVGPEGPRRVYALDTLNRLPVDGEGRRQNPFTRQLFNMRELRRGRLHQVG